MKKIILELDVETTESVYRIIKKIIADERCLSFEIVDDTQNIEREETNNE